MSNATIAMEKFDSGYNCAQSVLFSYSDQIAVPVDSLLKISNGFGGGMGREQEVCGAVSGAIMVLGMLHGRGESDGLDKQQYTYSLIQEFVKQFTEKFGSIKCKNLLNGCNLKTEEGQELFKKMELKRNTCMKCVGEAVNILENMKK